MTDLPIIPLVARRPEDRDASWQETLTTAFGGKAVVKALEALSETEKANATVAIVADPDPEDLKTLPKLKWVHSLWAGVEHIVAELGQTDLEIVRMIDPRMAETMAEAVLAWTLYLHRDMPYYASNQRARIWDDVPYKAADERNVTLLGLGHLGQVAARQLQLNGFNVRGWSRSPKSIDGIETFSGEDGLKEVLRLTDILVILMPLTAETRGMISQERLALLPNGACLINFARGPIIRDEDLLAALASGHIKHAVLDVFATEPLPQDAPYWTHPSVTVLPHISAPTTRKTASVIVARNITAYLETGALPAQRVDRSRGY